MNETDEFGPVKASQVLRNLGLAEEMVRAHVIRPPHIAEAVTGVERFGPVRHDDAPPRGTFYRLNVEGFGRDLHALLRDCVVGYSMQLRRNGRILLSRQWKWAKTRDDGEASWTADVPMHLASVSKLITAMAMTRILADRGVSPDSTIAGWLPAYWQIGHHANRITFRHLLTHTSGLYFGGDITPSDFLFMKHQVAKGTTHLGEEDEKSYQNINYGLCRILISTLSGAVATSTRFDLHGIDLTDAFWDLASIHAYHRYVSDNIFAPAGVTVHTLDYHDDYALGYTFPVVGKGWSSDDLSTLSGGVGWHLSTAGLLDVMGTFRRRGTIVSQTQAQAMLENKFGLDRTFPQDTQLGRIYAKGGFWGHDGRIQQSNAYFLPKGMELVILANSPFCEPNRGFMPDVTRVIERNIRFDILSVVTGIFWSAVSLVTRDRARRLPR
jgi:CubicO group peptidase (beta-lactamase class C family)